MENKTLPVTWSLPRVKMRYCSQTTQGKGVVQLKTQKDVIGYVNGG